MKVRSGFVSNSSSSSFIIGCDKIPTSINEMEELLGKKELSYYKDCKTNEINIISSKEVATNVFSKIKTIENLQDLYYEDYYNDEDNCTCLEFIKNDCDCYSPTNDIEVQKLVNERNLEYAKLLNISIEEIENQINLNKYFNPALHYLTVIDLEIIEAKEKLKDLNKNLERKEQKSFQDEFPKLYNRYKELEKKINEVSMKYSNLLFEYNQEQLLKKKYFFTVTYADENGSYESAFEHGGTFDNVNVAICNNH